MIRHGFHFWFLIAKLFSLNHSLRNCLRILHYFAPDYNYEVACLKRSCVFLGDYLDHFYFLLYAPRDDDIWSVLTVLPLSQPAPSVPFRRTPIFVIGSPENQFKSENKRKKKASSESQFVASVIHDQILCLFVIMPENRSLVIWKLPLQCCDLLFTAHLEMHTQGFFIPGIDNCSEIARVLRSWSILIHFRCEIRFFPAQLRAWVVVIGFPPWNT